METHKIRRLQKTFQVFGFVCLFAMLYYFFREGALSTDSEKTRGGYHQGNKSIRNGGALTTSQVTVSKGHVREAGFGTAFYEEEDDAFPDEAEMFSKEISGGIASFSEGTRQGDSQLSVETTAGNSSLSAEGDDARAKPKTPKLADDSSHSVVAIETSASSSGKAKEKSGSSVDKSDRRMGSTSKGKLRNKGKGTTVYKTKEESGSEAKLAKNKDSAPAESVKVESNRGKGNVTRSSIAASHDQVEKGRSKNPKEVSEAPATDESGSDEGKKAEASGDGDASSLPETNGVEVVAQHGANEDVEARDHTISPQTYFEMMLAINGAAQQSQDARDMHKHIPMPPVNEKAMSDNTDVFGTGVVSEKELGEIDRAMAIGGTEENHPIVFLSPKVPHPFLLAGLPKQAEDLDVISKCIYESGVFAPCESMLFHRILEGKCRRLDPETEDGESSPPGGNARRLFSDGSADENAAHDDAQVLSTGSDPIVTSTLGFPEHGYGVPLVVDIGANMGYFTLMAASYGCRVVGFEPQKHLFPFLSTSILVNDFERLAKVYNYAAVATDDEEISFAHPNVSGGWSLGHIAADGSGEDTYKVAGRRLDSVVGEDIYLLKVDVEGHGHDALAGATKIFQRHEILNLVMEANDPNDDGAFIANMKSAGYYAFGYTEMYTIPIHKRCWADFEDCFSRCGVAQAINDDGKLQPSSDYILTRDPALAAILEAAIEGKQQKSNEI